jgi:hypothetical protein
LLYGLAPAWIDPEEPPATAPVLAVRSVVLPAMSPPPALEAAQGAVPAPKVARAARPRPAASQPAPSTPPPPAAPPVVVEPTAVVPAPAEPVTSPAVSAEAAATTAIDVPVYATQLPAAGSWRYQLTRGIASGQAQLNWRPDAAGERYEMQLEGFIGGVTVLDWVSTGALDFAGIAPERFVIRRRGRDSLAANFQRDAAKITFSGPTHEVPLLPGVQDRLSWMLQLAAVIDAAPQRFAAGSSVVLMVVGARGGADVWTFRVVGAEPAGGAEVLKLVREARKPRDLQVEVWLDPARGHLPQRALLTQPEGGAPLELVLQGASTGP